MTFVLQSFFITDINIFSYSPLGFFFCPRVQDDIRSVLKEGRLLLSNLVTVKASKRDAEEQREVQVDVETVHR